MPVEEAEVHEKLIEAYKKRGERATSQRESRGLRRKMPVFPPKMLLSQLRKWPLSQRMCQTPSQVAVRQCCWVTSRSTWWEEAST